MGVREAPQSQTAEDRTTAIHTLLLNYFCDAQEQNLRKFCADWGKGHLYESVVKVINHDRVLRQANASRKKGDTQHRHLAIRRLKELLPSDTDWRSTAVVDYPVKCCGVNHPRVLLHAKADPDFCAQHW